ncbi:MAG: phosphatidate cytidylyltransferase [Planctomycetaceae bacterium]
MLRWRLLVSAVLIPCVIGLFVWDARLGPAAPVLFVICLLAGLRCVWELLLLLRRDTPQARCGPVAACVVLLLMSAWGPHWQSALGGPSIRIPTLDQVFAGCVLLLLVLEVFRFREPGGHVRTLGAELLAVTYAGLLLSVTAQLRWIGPNGNGYLALGSLIAAAKMGDVGAYTLGKLFGRRKMAPYLSPGKTWMGAFGAVLGAVVGTLLWLRPAVPLFGLTWNSQWWAWACAYGAVMGVAGLLGDLCESLIKRDVGVKDSAVLLPGFGGLLDLLDSILFAGPVAVVLWRLFY